MPNLKLIVGLGNPESRYQYTRHNAGALFLQYIAEAAAFPPFVLEQKWRAQISRGVIDGTPVILLFPQTWMNDSGLAVAPVVNFYKLDPATDLLIAFDDLDLSFGQFKLSPRPPRTHNGLASIHEHLGKGAQLSYLRLGIDDRHGDRTMSPADYVLSSFSPVQLQEFSEQIFPTAFQEVRQWL